MKDAALTLTLLDVAKITWPLVPRKGTETFEEYCKFLFDQKEDVWIICSGSDFLGMIAAKMKSQLTLYITIFVTLSAAGFKEFVRQAEGHFGPIDSLSYLRRGRPVTINFNKFKEKVLNNG